MYNGYNPYLNQFYSPQGLNKPQVMEMPTVQQNTSQMSLNRQNILCGKPVDSLEVAKATDISLDGSVNYFPLTNGSAIITKQLMQDGTSKIVVYEPKAERETIKYATIEDIDKKIEKIDFSEIDDIKDELNEIRKELKEVKNKLKSKKED